MSKNWKFVPSNLSCHVFVSVSSSGRESGEIGLSAYLGRSGRCHIWIVVGAAPFTAPSVLPALVVPAEYEPAPVSEGPGWLRPAPDPLIRVSVTTSLLRAERTVVVQGSQSSSADCRSARRETYL